MRLLEDLEAFSKGSKKKMFATIIANPCFHCVAIFRLSNLFYKLHLSPVSKLLWYINRLLFYVDIDYRADLAGGLVLIHGLGVVIGSGVRSEGRLTVYQGVTIGGSGSYIYKDERKIWMPHIGENVKLYTDCKLFGPVFIEDNTIVKSGQIISYKTKGEN